MEEVVAYFKVLSKYLPDGSDGNHEWPEDDIPIRILSEYETWLLRTLNFAVCLPRAELRPSATPTNLIYNLTNTTSSRRLLSWNDEMLGRAELECRGLACKQLGTSVFPRAEEGSLMIHFSTPDETCVRELLPTAWGPAGEVISAVQSVSFLVSYLDPLYQQWNWSAAPQWLRIGESGARGFTYACYLICDECSSLARPLYWRNIRGMFLYVIQQRRVVTVNNNIWALWWGCLRDFKMLHFRTACLFDHKSPLNLSYTKR